LAGCLSVDYLPGEFELFSPTHIAVLLALALLTPDSTYGFPHYRLFQVFLSHGAIVTASVYMTSVSGHRPTLRSICHSSSSSTRLLALRTCAAPGEQVVRA
jgi:uncharacterized membrane protein YwaF